jgi:hypothetical protein
LGSHVSKIRVSPEGDTAKAEVACQDFLTREKGVRVICNASARLKEMSFAADAPSAFILDSLRLHGTHPIGTYMFDNRWMVFPQDFPSASTNTLAVFASIRWNEKAGLPRDAIRSQCSTCSRHKEKETGYEKD